MKSRKKKTKPAPVMGSFKLARQSLADYKTKLGLYSKLTVVIALPSAILQVSGNNSQTQDLSLTLYIMSLYAVAAILSVARKDVPENPKKLSSWYQTSSARFFPLLATGLLLMLVLIPMFVGTLFILFTTSLSANIWFFIGGLIMIVVSLMLLARSIFVFCAVMQPKTSSIMAYRISWRITKRRFWRVVGLLLVFGVPFALISLLALIPSTALGTTVAAKILGIIITTTLLTFSLPIFFVYLNTAYQSYRASYDQSPGR